MACILLKGDPKNKMFHLITTNNLLRPLINNVRLCRAEGVLVRFWWKAEGKSNRSKSTDSRLHSGSALFAQSPTALGLSVGGMIVPLLGSYVVR